MFCRDYSQAWCIKKQKHQHQDGNPHTAYHSSTSDYFKPRKSSAATTEKQATSCLSRGAKALNRAAAAPGQRRVSDFYYIDPNNVKNEDYLRELEMSDEPPVCIVLSDSNENEGPMEVSSPASHTQVFEHPNLSPIGNKSDDDCFIIESSSSSSYYCTCR